jgi:hypothetical protein
MEFVSGSGGASAALFAMCVHECVAHRGPADNRDPWPARITAALVFLIQPIGGKGKGEKNSDE